MPKIFRKKAFKIALVIVLVLLLGLGLLFIYGKYQMRKLPALSFADALAFTTQGNKEAVITVGVIENGQASYVVYGEDAKVLPPLEHTYEIGSLTKTFTAALLNKAIGEGRIALNDGLERYLPLPEGNSYPTIEALLTHTSGCRGFYFASPMVANFFSGRNSFYAVSKAMLLEQAGRLNLPEKTYPFRYSNFGYAVLGLVLESVYQQDCTTLLNDFAQNELGLKKTKISDGRGDLGKYWDWQPDDAYLPAGGLTSTIEDMLAYAKLQLEEAPAVARCREELREIGGTSADYEAMGIRMDAVGMAWIHDKENDFIWHNGGTGHYNCYLGFCPAKGQAVVVLSNLPPDYRIPATILGLKLLQELGG